MLRPLSLALAFAAATGPVAAQTVSDCSGFVASAENIFEPWEDYSRTFANGDIRVAMLDTIEPAAAAVHLLVLAPPYDELGGRRCAVVGENRNAGFGDMDFPAMQASYTPATGLTLTVPIRRFDPNSGDFLPRLLSVTINQANGAVAAVVN